MPFYSTGPHYCQNCEPSYRRPKNREPVREGVRLVLVEQDYSALGVDIARCPECSHHYQISYKIDKVVDVSQNVT